MRQEVFMAGMGGQGVLLAGQILAQAALEAGLELSWFPLYSPEVRGGWVTCTLVIADGEVGSPVVGRPQKMILMDGIAVDNYLDRIHSGGLAIINTSLASGEVNRDDIELVTIPATDIAAQLGSEQATNMVLLGAYVQASGVVELQAVEQALHRVLPERHHDYIPTNVAALQRGAQLAEEQLQ